MLMSFLQTQRALKAKTHPNKSQRFKTLTIKKDTKEQNDDTNVLNWSLANDDGFSGLAVSMLASGTRVRGFKPGQCRWIFQASEKSSTWLPSEGKWKNLSHVPALRHVKEPSTYTNYECASKIPCIAPSFTSRGLSCLCGAWRLWRWMRGTHWGQRYNRPTMLQCRKSPTRNL